MFKISLLALALVSLASCGGDSSSDDYQMAIDQAAAKQAEAIALAPASPCSAVQQCSALSFVEPMGHCTSQRFQAYSLATPTADAASAAAADERALAIHAVALAPPPVTACAQVISSPPSLACVASTCQAVAPAN